MEKLLRNIIIGLFVIVLLGGIYFAMSVNGPGLPAPEGGPEIQEEN